MKTLRKLTAQQKAESFLNKFQNSLLTLDQLIKKFTYEDRLYTKPLKASEWKELKELRELYLITEGKDPGAWNLGARHLHKWSV